MSKGTASLNIIIQDLQGFSVITIKNSNVEEFTKTVERSKSMDCCPCCVFCGRFGGDEEILPVGCGVVASCMLTGLVNPDAVEFRPEMFRRDKVDVSGIFGVLSIERGW